MPTPDNCHPGTTYFGVGDRWANETALRTVGSDAVIRLDLTVTFPDQIVRQKQPTDPLDPRLLWSAGRCPQSAASTTSISGKFFQDAYPDETTKYASDYVGIADVSVSVPELGLSTSTDLEGCYAFAGFDVPEARLFSATAAKEGFGTFTAKNIFISPDRKQASVSGGLRRSGRNIVDDRCAFVGPPGTAAESVEAKSCASLGAGPAYLRRGCHYDPDHFGQQSLTLRQLMGIVTDAQTGAGIPDASVALPEWGMTTRGDSQGCFTFGVFDVANRPEVTTLELSAPGYSSMRIQHFMILRPSIGLDLSLRMGTEAQTIDYCQFDSPPDTFFDEQQELSCDRLGLLQNTY